MMTLTGYCSHHLRTSHPPVVLKPSSISGLPVAYIMDSAMECSHLQFYYKVLKPKNYIIVKTLSCSRYILTYQLDGTSQGERMYRVVRSSRRRQY